MYKITVLLKFVETYVLKKDILTPLLSLEIQLIYTTVLVITNKY